MLALGFEFGNVIARVRSECREGGVNFAGKYACNLLGGVEVDILDVVQAFFVGIHHRAEMAVDGEGVRVLDYLAAGELADRVDGEACGDVRRG